MQLELERKDFFDDRTIGGFYINGTWYCYSLEDTDRKLESDGVKVPKQTAIPRGNYKVIIDHSTRFDRDMPHVCDVPQFEGIRIHAGNVPTDTEGCILLGMGYDTRSKNITYSKIAFDGFFERLKKAIDDGEEVRLEAWG